jgi:hypothetical protein
MDFNSKNIPFPIYRNADAKNHQLWINLGVSLSLIISLAIGLISFLNLYVFQKTYKDLNIARLSVVARDLRETVEVGLNLGLSPQSNTELDGLVFSIKEKTQGLRFLVIIDEKGSQLNHAGAISSEWKWAKRLDGNSWTDEDSESYQVGLPFRNNFGIVVGAVIVGYDKSALELAVTTMRNSLVIDWLYAAGAVFVTMLSGVWFLTIQLQRDLDLSAKLLEHTFTEKPFNMSLPVLGPDIKEGLTDFVRISRNTSEELNRSLKSVSKS